MTTFIRAISFLILFISVSAVAEIDPLKLYIRTDYPANARTVGNGAEWLLEETGYQIILVSPAPIDSRELAEKTMPPMARMRRTMTIEDALQTLVGTENFLIIDRKNKLISFTKYAELQ